MKKIYYLFALVASLLVGCKGETVDVSGIVAERDSIKEASIRQQQELDNLNAFVDVVANGLDSIAIQEGFLRNMGPERGGMTREQMKQSLSELAGVLARQRARISQLEDSMNVKGQGTDKLRNIIAYLNEQLEEKELLITQLRAEVNNQKVTLSELRAKYKTLNDNAQKLEKKSQIQQQALQTQSDMMNECYVKIGTKKQLKQAGIIEGGLLKKTKINAGSLTPDNFSKVDIRKFTEISLPSKNPKILTTMPQGSYTMVRNPDGTTLLTINDPSLFWSSSNYLVISLD